MGAVAVKAKDIGDLETKIGAARRRDTRPMAPASAVWGTGGISPFRRWAPRTS
jgi:hypothetical protein